MILGVLAPRLRTGTRGSAWTILSITLLSLVSAVLSLAITDANTVQQIARDSTLLPRAPIANGVDLRVLPIGDSITWGAQSSDSAGYRKRFHARLEAAGNNVKFVGSITSGNMANNQHEGHRGKIITEIATMSTLGIYAAANIVLVHAGTNDMKNNIDPPRAPQRLTSLIDLIYQYSPQAVVLVCQIVPATNQNTAARLGPFNKAIPDLVFDYVSAGKKVKLVDMYSDFPLSELADGLHPNDAGYARMADRYYDAIMEVDAKGWISKPGSATPIPPGTDTCSSPDWNKVGEIATGPQAQAS